MLFRSRYAIFQERKNKLENELERIKNLQITNKKEVNEFLEQLDSVALKKPISLYELIKRPELNYRLVAPLDAERCDLPMDIVDQIDIIAKYEGYIQKQLEQVEQ